jgi:transposase-like protein
MYPSSKDGKGGYKMKNKFTEEQLRLLRANVNVEQATEYYVVFTEQFKQLAWEQKQTGKRMRDIFRENGIDPELLGKKRIENFCQMLNHRGREGSGFKDRRVDNRRPTAGETAETLEEQVKRLQHELAYTRQEVEFLKKLQMANTEARKQWESKHRPK